MHTDTPPEPATGRSGRLHGDGLPVEDVLLAAALHDPAPSRLLGVTSIRCASTWRPPWADQENEIPERSAVLPPASASGGTTCGAPRTRDVIAGDSAREPLSVTEVLAAA